MPNDIVAIQHSLDAIDIRKLAELSRKLNDIGGSFNKLMAPVYMRDFIVGYDVAATMLAKAIQSEMNAKALLDQVEAIAFLDRAPDYFKAKNEKPTVESKKAYVALDEDVLRAKEVHARATALVSLLKNKVQEFRFGIDAVKKLSEDGYMTQYEGMK